MSNLFYEIGGAADLITPIAKLIQSAYHGSAFHINIHAACGYSAVQVEDALRKKGIYVWGGSVIDDIITFNVRSTQAEYALYWLDQWQIPVDGHSELPHEAHKIRSGEQPSRSNPLANLFDSINALTRKLGEL